MAEFAKLTGFKELAQAMRQLPDRVAKNALRRAVSSAAAVVRNEARARAPVDTGEMKRDIQMKRDRDTKGQVSARYLVFVRSGKKSRMAGKGRNVNKDSFYWRFLEFGTVKMTAKPFMRPAFEAKKQEALEQLRKTLKEGIETEAQKLRRK